MSSNYLMECLNDASVLGTDKNAFSNSLALSADKLTGLNQNGKKPLEGTYNKLI